MQEYKIEKVKHHDQIVNEQKRSNIDKIMGIGVSGLLIGASQLGIFTLRVTDLFLGLGVILGTTNLILVTKGICKVIDLQNKSDRTKTK